MSGIADFLEVIDTEPIDKADEILAGLTFFKIGVDQSFNERQYVIVGHGGP
jgi:hypothetical protein